MKIHDPCLFQSQNDPGSSPTAQTREGTTPLMLLRLQECDLMEGSEFQDLGNHEAAITRSVGRHGGQLVEIKVNRDMHDLTFHKNQPIEHLMPPRKPFQGRESFIPKLKEDHIYFHLWNIFKLFLTKYNTYG